MLMRIATGAMKDVQVGSKIKINPDYTPHWFTKDDLFEVFKVETHKGISYPYVLFYKEEAFKDENDHDQVRVLFDDKQESAVDPSLILDVI